MDVSAAVYEHEQVFNDAVRSGNYAPLVAAFADDAVMSFDDLPTGPFQGREAIRRAYADQPPTDALTTRSIEHVGVNAARVLFDWDHGGSGSMMLIWRDGYVASLAIAFDA
jgi:steroid delta-isomerase